MIENSLKKVTLREYIEQNDKLLTALGIFIALTVFFSSIEVKIFAAILSLISLTCTVLIWIELWITFPEAEGTGRLIWFENVLSLGAMGLIIYWLHIIYQLHKGALVYPIRFFFMYLISVCMKRKNIFNRIFKTESGKHKTIRYIIGISLIFAVYLGSMLLALSLYPYLTNFFDKIELQSF